MMKAIVYTEYGPPDVLHVEEVAQPEPKSNELLIRIHARPVNYGDLLARDFKHTPVSKFNMPLPLYVPTRVFFGLSHPRVTILGSEFAGDVEAVGSAVTNFAPGDKVFGYVGQRMGAYAEYLCVPADGSVGSMPANMSYAEAAALPYGGIMALGLLRKVPIQPGDRVLINGASGGIGSMAVQLAQRHFGAHVTGVCGTPRIDFVKALGADRVIDYSREDFTQSGERYNLIFDILGKCSFARCKRALTADGRLLFASFKGRQLLDMLRTAIAGRQKVICALAAESAESLRLIKDLAEAGKIRAIIDKRFPLEQAAEAHRYVEAGRKTGHVIIIDEE